MRLDLYVAEFLLRINFTHKKTTENYNTKLIVGARLSVVPGIGVSASLCYAIDMKCSLVPKSRFIAYEVIKW